MTGSPFTLDPEVRGLIEEIAAEPGSVLFQKPTSDVLHSPYDRLRSTTPGLSVAERHLVQVHAEELAYWLRVLCYHGLASYGTKTRPYGRFADLSTHQTDVPAFDSCVAFIRRERGHTQLPERLEHADLSTASTPSIQSVAEISALSNKFVPTEEARTYYALSLLELGEPHTALCRLQNLAQTTRSIKLRALSHASVGRVLFCLERYAEAADSYRSSVRSGPPFVASLAGWLVAATIARQSAAADEAARALDSCLAVDHPAIDDFIERNFSQSASSDSADTASRRIMNALG